MIKVGTAALPGADVGQPCLPCPRVAIRFPARARRSPSHYLCSCCAGCSSSAMSPRPSRSTFLPRLEPGRVRARRVRAERDRREAAGLGDRLAEQQSAILRPARLDACGRGARALWCSYDKHGETTAAGQQRRKGLWSACPVLLLPDGTVQQVSARSGRSPYAGFVLVRWNANPEKLERWRRQKAGCPSTEGMKHVAK
jgi:hypothetical protein